MWSHPKQVVRTIIHSKPNYGLFSLATLYALQSLFSYANWWSIGLSHQFYTILTLGVLLSPIFGLIIAHFSSAILYLAARAFRGTAPFSHVRVALVWSWIPFSLNLLMWLILIFLSPNHVFVLDATGVSSVFINLISLIANIWAFVLLVQGLSEVEQFSAKRSIAVIVCSWIVMFILVVIIAMLIRFASI